MCDIAHTKHIVQYTLQHKPNTQLPWAKKTFGLYVWCQLCATVQYTGALLAGMARTICAPCNGPNNTPAQKTFGLLTQATLAAGTICPTSHLTSNNLKSKLPSLWPGQLSAEADHPIFF